ncbi:MAG: sigma-70 family RNA polymerase sigma factor [bacterium]|nr:sigma-70 family RNA polymerase sigma factor [bacterium]
MTDCRKHDPAREAEWIALAREGDRAAFDRIVRAHFRRVYALLHRLVGNHEDAEDLAQECFVRAYRNLHHLRPGGSFPSWLGQIAVHLAQDHHRSRGRRRVEPLEGFADHASDREDGPPAELSRREVVRKIGEAVERLPYPLRTALVLRVLEGRDYDEVADLCGVRPTTVRTQVMKARRLLMRWIAPLLESKGEGSER